MLQRNMSRETCDDKYGLKIVISDVYVLHTPDTLQ